MLPDLISFINSYTKAHLSFKNDKLLNEYQKQWISLFSKIILKSLSEKPIMRYNESFAIPINISKNITINIHFDIDILLEEVDKVNPPVVQIDIQQFIENNFQNQLMLLNNPQLIGYAIDKSLKNVSSNPVVICNSDFFFNFVLDGNHRVDYAKRNKYNVVNCLIVSSKFLATTPHLFEDKLSYLLFCFLEDVALLEFALHEKRQKGIFGILRTESSLLKKQSILPTVQKYIGNTYHQN